MAKKILHGIKFPYIFSFLRNIYRQICYQWTVVAKTHCEIYMEGFVFSKKPKLNKKKLHGREKFKLMKMLLF